MRVVFLQDSAVNESLALTMVSAVLKAAGHPTRLFLGDEEADLDACLRDWDADLAIIPCHVTGHRVALEFAERIKRLKPGCVVALGGTHVTFDPDLARHPAVDVCCVGEAEGAMLVLADALARGEGWDGIPNLAYEEEGQLVQNPLRPLREDLDTLPLPDRDLYFRYPFISRFPWKKFNTSRGCVHSCTFCWNTPLRAMYEGKGTFTRRKSPARAVEEVRVVAERHPLKMVHFSDDLFTIFPGWLEEFARLYKRDVGIPFTCSSSIEMMVPRVAKALQAAGCRGVAIGVETGNEQLRSRIHKKTVTNDDVRRAAALIHAHGMEITAFCMIANPGETLEDALGTIALMREIKADHVRCNIAVPLPHTEFETGSIAAGLLDPDYTRHRVDSMKTPQPAFKTDDARAFTNLFYLFRPAVHHPRLDPLVRRLVHLPTPRVLDFLRLYIPLEEKRIYHIGWRDGLRYFSHVGDPHKRTANYVTLI